MTTRVFGFLDTAFAVESNDEHTLDWLDEFLGPWFDRTAGQRELNVGVRHVRGAEISRRAAPARSERVACLLLDSRIVHLTASRQGSTVIVEDAQEGCCYTFDAAGDRLAAIPEEENPRRGRVTDREGAGAIRLTVEAEGSTGRLCLMRMIREIAMEHERRHARSLELHAAALEIGGEAVAFAGPKGSGKTTLLLHAATRWPAGLISNDRVLVAASTGRLRVTGVPAVIRVDSRTASDLPGFRSRFPPIHGLAESTLAEARALAVVAAGDGASALRLSAAQLAGALSAPLVVGAPLRTIVFPEIGASSDSPILSRLSPVEATHRLCSSLYGGRGLEDVPTVVTEVVTRACRGARSAASVRDARAELLARLGSAVPCFRLVPGREIASAVEALRREVLA